MEKSIADHKSQMSTLADSQRRHQRAMDSADSAAKEAWEEAGVCQVDANKIGTYEYHKRAKTPGRGVFVAGRNGSERLAGASTRKSS